MGEYMVSILSQALPGSAVELGRQGNSRHGGISQSTQSGNGHFLGYIPS
jgi:hypothetical protein